MSDRLGPIHVLGRMMTQGILVAVPVAMLLSACALLPGSDDDDETLVDLVIIGQSDLNPDNTERPSPASVQILELTSEDPFRTRSYFDLRDDREEALGPTLLSHREVVLNPASSLSRSFEVDDEARILGLIIDFRDVETTTWRSFISLRTGETNRILAQVDDSAVRMTLDRSSAPDGWWDKIMDLLPE